MNKAFTKESDFDPMAELVIRPAPVLPAGAKNYITPVGARAVQAELRELESDLRPRLLEELTARAERGLQEEKEHKMLRARLQQVDEQIRHLKERVATFEVVPPRPAPQGAARFGDRVVALDAAGERHEYTIVGADEADPDSGRISWVSPLGRAFLGAEEGDEVTVRRPRGDVVMEIQAILAGEA